jgi:hypothetical protein
MAGRHRRVHGRHRRPTPPRAAAARVALAGTAVAVPVGVGLDTGTAEAATAGPPPGGWGAIVHCESGGNPRASNGTHFGLFQFDLATWRSVGGTVHPLNATPAEQISRANALFAARGLQPWTASRSCWAGSTRPLTVRGGITPPARVAPTRTGATRPAPKLAPKLAPRPAPRRVAPHPTSRAHSHRVLRGDTVLKIARANGVPWRSVHGFRSGNPNLIFPGEIVTWRK